MTYLKTIQLFLFCWLLSGCTTTDSAMQQQGKSAAYIAGFHDGRHSGMSEQGNEFESYIKDVDRFSRDADYRQGWNEGEIEGKKIQGQAASVSNALGKSNLENAKREVSKDQDFDSIARDAVEGVDTTGFDALGK